MALPVDKLYEYIANEEDARVCRDIPDAACSEVPRNFFLILGAQLVGKLADALSSSKIVLPWLMSGLGVPAFFSGLLVPIRESGSLLPQLVIGGVVRRFPKRQYFYCGGALGQALCLLGLWLVAMHLEGYHAGLAIILLLVAFSLFRGLCSVASKDVLGKTVPKSRRGLLTGYATSGAGLITVVLGAAMLWQWQADTGYYALLLVAAALCWLVAAAAFSLIDEQPGATEGDGNALKEALARLSLLREDRPFRHFVIVRSLMMSSGLAAPYFIILARDSRDGGAWTQLGAFIVISGLAGLVSGVFWGRWADVSSRRLLQVTAGLTALLCAVAASLPALDSGGLFWPLLVLFFLLTIAHQGVRIARKTYVVDLAGGNRRTDYVAVSNTAIGLLLLLAGLLGAAVSQISLSAVLLLFACASGLAALIARHLPEVS